MNKLLVSGIVLAAALAAAAAVWLTMAEEGSKPAFIKGGGPVTEEQVRQEMLAEGFSNPQVARQGRYLEAMGTRNGQTQKLVVDAWTGRLREGEDDD
jgi:hypothetical protein